MKTGSQAPYGRFPVFLLGAIALGEAIFFACQSASNSTVWILWFWGVFAGIRAVRQIPRQAATAPGASWFLIVAAIGAAMLRPMIGVGWALWLAVGSLIARVNGWRAAIQSALPAFILLILVPGQEFLLLLLSYPLSRMATWLTVGMLHLTGIAATAQQTVIRVGADEIAVTAACSGVELLEVMLLAGWIIVIRNPAGAWLRLCHFLLVIPIIVFCNAVRLTAVIVLFRSIGTEAFAPLPHMLFGVGVVAATILLMLGAGKLFRTEARA